MDNCTVFIGLDYHENTVQMCVMDQEGNQLRNCRCANDPAAIADRIDPGWSVQKVAIEACNGAAAFSEKLMERFGWDVRLGHPTSVAKRKKSADKTDFNDAQHLADLVRVGYLPEAWLAPPHIRQLRELVRYRQQLVNRRRSTKQRIRAVLGNHRIKAPRSISAWTRAWNCWLLEVEAFSDHTRWVIQEHLEDIDHLSRQIARAEARLEQAVADDPLIERLRREPGVGKVTSWVIRSEIGVFNRFRSGKKLANFCGLSPRNRSSGKRQAQGGIVRIGSRMLKSTLIELAQRLIRHQPRWQALAARLEAQGKSRSLAAAAVANRWIRGLYWRMMQPNT